MKKDMMPEINKKYNTIAAYVLIVSAIILCAITLIVYIGPVSEFFRKVSFVMNPFFYAFAIAFVLLPLCNFFERLFLKIFTKFKYKAKLSSFLGLLVTYIIFLAFLSLFFYIIIPQVENSIEAFASNYDLYLLKIENLFKKLPNSISRSFNDIIALYKDDLSSLIEKTLQFLTDHSPKIISALSDFAMGVWNIVLGFIISIYMLAERKVFARQLKKLTFALFSKSTADGIVNTARVTKSVFSGFVTGKLLEALIVGFLCFIGTSTLDIPYAMLISIIVGVTDVIPYVGPFLGGIPSFIIIFLNDPIKAIWFVIFIIALQQIDSNIIGPKILKETIGVSSFWVIFSLLIMGSLYGIVGMILAVPLFALIHMGISRLCDHLLDKKGYCKQDLDSEQKEDGTHTA